MWWFILGGGRAPRVGYALTLDFLIQLQTRSGGIGGSQASLSIVDDARSVLKMAGTEHNDSTCLSSESASTINTTVTNKSNSSWLASCRNDSSEDATLARHATSHVIRNAKGQQASEQSQQLIIRDFAELCQICSPSPSSSSEGIDPDPKIPAMSDKSCVSKNQVQVVLIEVSHLVTALGEASSTTLEYLVGPLSGCVRHSSPGVRLEAA
ncbi:MAG: hypothetical protein ACREBR_04005, partial [bacterium]